MMLVSIEVVVVLLVGGLFYFKKMEQYFADGVIFMTGDISIRVRGLGKKYQLGECPEIILSSAIPSSIQGMHRSTGLFLSE